METGLQLLMRDGSISVRFHPRLDADQYAELMQVVDRATTKGELKAELERAGKQWEKEVIIDD